MGLPNRLTLSLGQIKKCGLGNQARRPYQNFLVRPRIYSGFLEKKYNFKHFKMHKIRFFPQKNIIKKKEIYVPILPKVFRPVTRNTFFIWPQASAISSSFESSPRVFDLLTF